MTNHLSAEEMARSILKASNAGVLAQDGGSIDLQHWAVGVAQALLSRADTAESAPPVTHPELEEAIKHVTAYDSAQIGMLDYTKLWRLIVAARHCIWMLKRVEELQGERAAAPKMLGALRAVRVYVQDCIENGYDRTMLGNMYGARDEIDAALAKVGER